MTYRINVLVSGTQSRGTSMHAQRISIASKGCNDRKWNQCMEMEPTKKLTYWKILAAYSSGYRISTLLYALGIQRTCFTLHPYLILYPTYPRQHVAKKYH